MEWRGNERFVSHGRVMALVDSIRGSTFRFYIIDD